MKNVIVKTHPLHEISDEQLTFAVISARMEGKFVFGRKRGSDTWEMPGGHREPGESVIATARRELYEETGAVDYALAPICAYSVDDGERLLYGVLFMADIKKLGPLPAYEMEEVRLFDEVPDALTYPKIQAKLSVISARHEHFGGIGEDITVRPAHYIDIDDIVNIYHPNFDPAAASDDEDDIVRIEEEFQMRTTEHLLRTTIEKPNKRVFVAFHGILPVGVCEVRTNNQKTLGEISGLAVLPEHRGLGIARLLTDTSVSFLQSIGCESAIVWIPSADEKLCRAADARGFRYDGTHAMTDHGIMHRYRRAL